MKLLVLIGEIVCGCTLVTNTMAAQNEQPEAVEIPLKEIWGWNIPGTRNMGTLEPNKSPNYAYGPLLARIRRTLADVPPKGKQARAGFSVLGTGLEALREAHAVLVEKKKPLDTFPMGSKISAVFFSYQTGSYVHLREIKQEGSIIRIYFRFVPHETREVSEHFALIPLAELSAGKVRVEVIQSPMEQRFVEAGFRPVSDEYARRIVCRSYAFTLVDGEAD